MTSATPSTQSSSAAASVSVFTSTPGASDTLSSLGGDLTLSIAFAVAHELLEGAKESEVTESELITMVLLFSIILSGLPSLLWVAKNEVLFRRRASVSPVTTPLVSSKTPAGGPPSPPSPPSGLLAFFGVFIAMCQRISLAVCVQLIASGVQSQQPLRSVRILTLLAASTFFVFISSTASFGRNAGDAGHPKTE